MIFRRNKNKDEKEAKKEFIHMQHLYSNSFIV
nr:hypothetical protein BSM_26130 [uncultured archaeon]